MRYRLPKGLEVACVAGEGGERPLPEWFLVVPFGTWRGHPQGTFTIGQAEAEEIVSNFRHLGIEVVIDFEHQTHRSDENGQRAPAAGWIDDLEIRPTGIFAHAARWTRLGDTSLRELEYRYLSPTLGDPLIDPVTADERGWWLESVALTNFPFLREIPPLMSKANPNPDLLAQLGLKADASEDDLKAAIARLQHKARIGEAACKASGVPVDDVEVIAKVELRCKGVGMVPIDEHVAALRSGEAATQTAAREKILAKAKAEGKVTPALEPWFKGQLERDPDGAMEWLSKAAPVVPLKSPINVGATNTGTADVTHGLSEAELRICKQGGLDPKKYADKKAGRTA